jgi:hypothetical protein
VALSFTRVTLSEINCEFKIYTLKSNKIKILTVGKDETFSSKLVLMHEKFLLIGDDAFGNRGSLKQIEIPHPVTWWEARDLAES